MNRIDNSSEYIFLHDDSIRVGEGAINTFEVVEDAPAIDEDSNDDLYIIDFEETYTENDLANDSQIAKLLEENKLKYVKHIGFGENGCAVLYEYQGANPAILQLTLQSNDQRYIIVKRLSKNLERLGIQNIHAAKEESEKGKIKFENGIILSYQNEISIYKYLMNYSIADKSTDKSYPNVFILQDEDDKDNGCILMQYIAYGYDKKLNFPKSETLEKFIKRLFIHANKYKDKSFLMFLVVKTMEAILKDYKQLPLAGVLHLDLALRNILIRHIDWNNLKDPIKVTFIDNGRSKVMNSQGECQFTIDAKQYWLAFPCTHYNQSFLRQSILPDQLYNLKVSIYTDLFSLRIALMEVLSLLLNLSIKNILSLDPGENINNKNWYGNFLKLAKEQLDKDRLDNYLSNLENYAALQKKNNIRPELADVVLDIIKYFRPYLSGYDLCIKENILEVIHQEENIFNQCQKDIFTRFKLYDDWNSIVDQFKKFFENVSLFNTLSTVEYEHIHENEANNELNERNGQNRDALLKKYSLEKQTDIKSGQFGNISLYKLCLNEQNVLLQPLIHNVKEPYVVIKIPKCEMDEPSTVNEIMYKNEIEIYKHVMNQSTIALDQRKHPKAVILGENDEACLILEYIFYHKGGEPQAMDLFEFIKFIRTIDPKIITENVYTFTTLFNIMILKMYEAQHQLHKLNVLHIDTACRNFSIKFVNSNPPRFDIYILDFNLSIILNPDGTAEFIRDPKYGFYFPSHKFDLETLNELNLAKNDQQKNTIKMSIDLDLFAMRAVILEFLGLLLGMESGEIFDLRPDSEKYKKDDTYHADSYWPKWNQYSLRMSNDDRLIAYINNVRQYAENSSSPIDEIVKTLIDYYLLYLSKMPISQDKSRLMEVDEWILRGCYQNLCYKVGTLAEDKIGSVFQLLESSRTVAISQTEPSTLYPYSSTYITSFSLFANLERKLAPTIYVAPLPPLNHFL